MYHYVLIFIALFTPLSLICEQEEIVVHLKHSSSLKPLYLHSFVDKQSGLDKSYLEQLAQVLAFDLTHNGQTVVVPQKKELETQVNTFEKANWEANKIAYAIKV